MEFQFRSVFRTCKSSTRIFRTVKMVVSPEKFQNKVHLLKLIPEVFKKHQSLFQFGKKDNFGMVDVGTGPGTMLLRIEALLPKNYKEIIGTDRDELMIEYFNSLPKDPRITGRILDISAEKVPDDLKERFDFVFSSFCFGFVADLRKAFQNCNDLLKPKGETFFAWSTRSHMIEVYRSLSRIDKWVPYTSDYSKCKSLIEYEDPIGTLMDHLRAAGLDTVKIDEYKDFAIEEPEDVMLELFDSLDHIQQRIPQIDQKQYKEDFDGIVRTEIFEYEETDSVRNPKMPAPAIFVIARKH